MVKCEACEGMKWQVWLHLSSVVQPDLVFLLPRAKLAFRKEASGLPFFSGLFYTQELRGSNPQSPSI